jgi:hypothetical protein
MSAHTLHLVVRAEAQRMHFPGLHRTDEKRAATLIVTPERHLPGVVDTRPGLDAETRWQLDALQRQLIRGQGSGRTAKASAKQISILCIAIPRILPAASSGPAAVPRGKRRTFLPPQLQNHRLTAE